MNYYLNRIFLFISSPKLTVAIIFYAVIFIFFSTLQQRTLGITEVQRLYFESFFCSVNMLGINVFFLGGTSIALLGLINLLSSIFRYSSNGIRGFGFSMTHFGIVLLLFAAFLQYMWRKEGRMSLHEGEATDLIVMRSNTDKIETLKLPFKVELIKFVEEKWEGSDIPKQYSSDVNFLYEGIVAKRTIKMNEPASFGPWTFFQASFGEEGKLSVLQVVNNPASLLPTISIALIFFGMIIMIVVRIKNAK